MKLRNKKTGGLASILDDEQDFIRVYTDAGWHDYNTLAELTEEWEDYAPAEPLIKDEKIRKAVREWAEVNNAGKVEYCTYPTGNCSIIFKCDSGEELLLDFSCLIDDLIANKTYTITELCGNEE